ncbi:MAG: xanthan lyase [Alistipes sp.]
MRNRFICLFLLCLLGTSPLVAGELPRQTQFRIGEMLSRIVEREISGGNTKVQSVTVSKKQVTIRMTIGMSYYPFREENVKAIYDSIRELLPDNCRKLNLALITDDHRIEELIPLACRRAEVPQKKSKKKNKKDATLIPFTNSSARPLVTPLRVVALPTKGLTGRHIALWQSHGRYFDQAKSRWKWQRSCLWQTCEDLYTQSYVLPYVVPMLENAGAYVLLPRERDTQKRELILDNDSGVDNRSKYTEYNGTNKWHDAGVGFAHLKESYRTGENPFTHGTTRSVQTLTQGEESRAVWSASIPKQDEYAVYVSYRTDEDSADDAHYTVHHLGGESSFAVNQTMGGGTWIYLGHFMLPKGDNIEVVTLTNLSSHLKRSVSADAVKIGGGYGNIIRSVGDSLRMQKHHLDEETSGYPRFCEGARYWLQWAGFDEEVYTPKANTDDYKDDYMSRAHWVNALMGGSERLPHEKGLHIPLDMALAVHSDAGTRTTDEVIGTLGIYYTKDNNGKFWGGADRYRSRDLTDLVMTEITQDIRRTYEPNWCRRGLWNRSYYEARVPNVPTMLLELLSHQNFADMRYGNDPRFKFLVSRAIYKGILKHLAAQYNTSFVVQPLPVDGFSVELMSDNNVNLRWRMVRDSVEESAVPTGYMIYTRIDNGGFDNGTWVGETSYMTEQTPGHIYSYKVTAINDGGESFPSETLAACRVPNEKGWVLVVNGFDRVSAPLSMRNDSLAGFYNAQDSGVPYLRDISFIGAQQVFDRALTGATRDELGSCNTDFETDIIGGNTFDYPYLHGQAIVQAGYSFCSTGIRAVERGVVSMNDYPMVDLILGKQRSTTIGRGVHGYDFKTFTPEMQRAVTVFLQAGGALFLSGSYVGTDLWTGDNSTEEDRAFAQNRLHYTYDAGQATTLDRVRVVTSNAKFSRDEYRFNNELVPDAYCVEAPDAILPWGEGAFSVMRYAENRRTAGVGYAGKYKTFVMGFPFEAIRSAEQRNGLMHDILNFFESQKLF